MVDRRVSENFLRFLRELRDDASTIEIIHLLLSVTLLAGSAKYTWDKLGVKPDWPSVGLAAGCLIIATLAWLLGFASGVRLRKEGWKAAYPPFDLIGRALAPTFILSVAVAMPVSKFVFPVGMQTGALVALEAWAVVMLAVVLLAVVHTPWTRWAIRQRGDHNIVVVDSYLHMWLFPALGVVLLYLLGPAFLSLGETDALAVSVSAGIAASLALAGFGSGYIP